MHSLLKGMSWLCPDIFYISVTNQTAPDPFPSILILPCSIRLFKSRRKVRTVTSKSILFWISVLLSPGWNFKNEIIFSCLKDEFSFFKAVFLKQTTNVFPRSIYSGSGLPSAWKKMWLCCKPGWHKHLLSSTLSDEYRS